MVYSDKEMSKFSGETPYAIMFGPDICGFGTKKTHVILTHNEENHLISKEPECKTDEVTHVYTLVLSPNNTYEVRCQRADARLVHWCTAGRQMQGCTQAWTWAAFGSSCFERACCAGCWHALPLLHAACNATGDMGVCRC